MSDEQTKVTPSRITVLATKLHIPQPRPDEVARPRLMLRLTEGLARPLVLISAPAGFGKTTLVGEWLAQSAGLPAAWLSLEEDDNDPARFLAYLISALDTLKPGLGADALSLLALPQLPPWKTIITTLLNSLAAIPTGFVLVLDDYHVLTDPVIHEALAYLLEHAPANMHLVILSRADPALPLARLRARGQMLELREADLRFTGPEATAFLSQTMQLALAPADVAALQRQTEGWIVGLQMAALCLAEPGMQEQGRPAGFIAAFGGSNRFILDYLMEEVLARQPEPVQRFLLHTAVLDRLCGPLCAAVLGMDGAQDALASQAVLADLERANLFTIPLDHERRWYRYHR
ncbi:MAG TPA: LuxR family transcriptional regulator, partial [Anaerolineae bacterium]